MGNSNFSFSCRKCLCNAIFVTLSYDKAIKKLNPKFYDSETGEKADEFLSQLRIVDIKGGPDDSLDGLGQTATMKGYFQALRVQSIVVLIEALRHELGNSGHYLVVVSTWPFKEVVRAASRAIDKRF